MVIGLHYSSLHLFTKYTEYDSDRPQTDDTVSTHHHHHHHRHFWQAPLRVCSAKRRHQSPEWTVLSQVNCVVHIKVAGFQILLNGLNV